MGRAGHLEVQLLTTSWTVLPVNIARTPFKPMPRKLSIGSCIDKDTTMNYLLPTAWRAIALGVALALGGCANMSGTQKGTAVGAGVGAAAPVHQIAQAR